MADLVRQYADFPLGTADASVIAVAERLGATNVATIDHGISGRSAPRTAPLSSYCLRSDPELATDSDNRASPAMTAQPHLRGHRRVITRTKAATIDCPHEASRAVRVGSLRSAWRPRCS